MNELIFKINEKQLKKLEDWVKTHECNHEGDKTRHNAVGVRTIFEITPTTLGDIIVAKCNVCGKTIDLTQYESF